jgi:hypothetical protein
LRSWYLNNGSKGTNHTEIQKKNILGHGKESTKGLR